MHNTPSSPNDTPTRACTKCGSAGPFYDAPSMRHFAWCIPCKRAANLAAYHRRKAMQRARRAARGELLRKDVNAAGRAAAPKGWKWCPFCQSYHRHGAFRPRSRSSKTGRASYCRAGEEALKRFSAQTAEKKEA